MLFSFVKQFLFKKFSLAEVRGLYVKTVVLQAVQFSIKFSSIWCTDKTLSGATTPCRSEPGSNGNEGVLCIPQISSNTGTSP